MLKKMQKNRANVLTVICNVSRLIHTYIHTYIHTKVCSKMEGGAVI